ncbi:MAG: squalene synthase HpnD [Legionellales bacterium]|nr:squalene synthase HpnD [Legionellales bacterium]|tara:strand:+ start:3946 stop:4776 length:831 start_codon:yes stop_codon:yes gene_type:complete
MEPTQYCEDKVAPRGSSLYYSCLFESQPKREAYWAVYAFCREIRDIYYECHEPDIAKRKLEWWRGEIEAIFKGASRHPVGQALQQPLAHHQLPQQLFIEYLDGLQLKLDMDHCCSEQDWQLFSYREQGIPHILAGYIGGYSEPATIKLIHNLGLVINRVMMILELRRDALKGKVFFPLAAMERVGVSPNDFADLTMTPALITLLTEFADQARGEYRDNVAKMNKIDRKQQRQSIIFAGLLLKLLDVVQADGFPVFEQQVQLTPLRKLWYAWRLRSQ